MSVLVHSSVALIPMLAVLGGQYVNLRLNEWKHGYLKEVDTQRFWGNFRDGRDPAKPEESRYPSETSWSDIFGAVKKAIGDNPSCCARVNRSCEKGFGHFAQRLNVNSTTTISRPKAQHGIR